MDIVHRPIKPKRADLIRLYDVCNRVFKNKDCFYTKEQWEKVKKEKIGIWQLKKTKDKQLKEECYGEMN